jgi:hypothetical protein
MQAQCRYNFVFLFEIICIKKLNCFLILFDSHLQCNMLSMVFNIALILKDIHSLMFSILKIICFFKFWSKYTFVAISIVTFENKFWTVSTLCCETFFYFELNSKKFHFLNHNNQILKMLSPFIFIWTSSLLLLKFIGSFDWWNTLICNSMEVWIAIKL